MTSPDPYLCQNVAVPTAHYQTSRSHRSWVHWALLIAVGCVFSLGVTTTALADDSPVHTPIPRGTSNVVLFGAVGLSWSDISAEATPNLWALMEGGASAATLSMHVPGDPCAINGWLTVSAALPTSAQLKDNAGCLPATVVTTTDTTHIDGWADLVERQKTSTYKSDMGLFGATLKDEGICATAIGAGGAMALADREGQVASFQEKWNPEASSCPITVIDGGVVNYGDTASLHQVDVALGQVVNNLPPDTTLMVATMAAAPEQDFGMGVGLLAGPDTSALDPQYLKSASTRWEGVVTLLDVPTTLLTLAGGTTTDAFVGETWVDAGPRPDTAASVDHLAMIGSRDAVLRKAAPYFLDRVGVLGVLLLIFVSIMPSRGRTWFVRTKPRRLTSMAVASAAAVIPAASYLVGGIPWWTFSHPGMGLIGVTLLVTAVLGVATFVLAGRRSGQLAAWSVALLTLVVLVIDALGQSFLDRASPAGPSPTFGGRFYGFGNTTGAYLSVSTVVVACLATGWLLARGRKWAAIGVFSCVSVVAVFIDVAPGFGADVGGGLALVPVLTLCGLALFGLKVTWGRVVIAFVAGVVIVAALAFIDWLGPADSRTHLGRFVQEVIDGDAGGVILRKAGYVVRSVTLYPATWFTIFVLAFLIYQLVAFRRQPPQGAWQDLLVDRPFRISLVGSLGVLLLGGAVNDYGLQVATIGLLLLVPLALLYGFSSGSGFKKLYGDNGDDPRPSEESEESGRPLEHARHATPPKTASPGAS